MRRFLAGALLTATILAFGATASEVWTWSTTASSNNAAPPDGFPENQARSTVNDGIRELMASLKRWYEDPEWLNLLTGYTVSKLDDDSFQVAGVDKTALFTGDRAVLVSNGSTSAVGFVQSTAYSAGNTIVNLVFLFGEVVPASTNSAKLHHSASLGRAAFLNNGSGANEFPVNGDLGTLAYVNKADLVGRTSVSQNTQSPAAGVETALTGMSNLAFPGGAVKHSVRFACGALICYNGSLPILESISFRVRVGTNGNLTDDTKLLTYSTCPDVASPRASSFSAPELDVVAGASDKLTVSVYFPSSATDERLVSSCKLVIEEVLE